MFTPDDRLIYRYSNGDRDMFGDPMVIKRTMIRLADGDLPGLIEKAVPPETSDTGDVPSSISQRVAAEERLLKIIREAFHLPEIDPETGAGVTDSMVWRVWDDFGEFIMGEKKREG